MATPPTTQWPRADGQDTRTGRHDLTIPIVAETARVEKKLVETGRLRVRTRPVERDETVEARLERSDVSVERVLVDRVVDEVPVPHQDGDTWVIPVMEERLVVTTLLVLKEELRITTTVRHEDVQHTVRLRSERVDIDDSGPGQPASVTHTTQGDEP